MNVRSAAAVLLVLAAQSGAAQAGDSLVAWIRGMQDGKGRRIEFAYTRARCGS